MSITSPESSEDINLDSILHDETTPMSLSEIYNQIVAHDEIILTIPMEEEAALRTGLAGVKSKQNTRMRAAGLSPDNSTLSFAVTPHKTVPNVVDIRITLSKKAVINVLAFKLPDNDF